MWQNRFNLSLLTPFCTSLLNKNVLFFASWREINDRKLRKCRFNFSSNRQFTQTKLIKDKILQNPSSLKHHNNYLNYNSPFFENNRLFMVETLIVKFKTVFSLYERLYKRFIIFTNKKISIEFSITLPFFLLRSE